MSVTKMPVHETVDPEVARGMNFVLEVMRVDPDTAAIHTQALAWTELRDLLERLDALTDFVYDLDDLVTGVDRMDPSDPLGDEDLEGIDDSVAAAVEIIVGAIATGPEPFLSRVAGLSRRDRFELRQSMGTLLGHLLDLRYAVGDFFASLPHPSERC